MGSPGPKGDGEFNRDNFPPHTDPANRETGMAELYPQRLQDEVNSVYNHDKVLPRVEGVDYTNGKAYSTES